MASAQNDTFLLGGTLITLGQLGASVFPTIVKSPSISGGQMTVHTLGSGATVQILPIAVAGASIGGATAVGASLVGYPFSSSDIISWVGPASFYLASTGAASVVKVLFEYSAQGASLQ
jgi:hypothetical protein